MITESEIKNFKSHLNYHKFFIFFIFICSLGGLILGALAYYEAKKDFKLLNASITTDTIASKSITSDKLADNIITASQLKASEILIVSGVESQNALSLTSSNSKDITISSNGAVDIDADTTLQLNSSGGIISIGNDNNAHNINLGTSASRIITIGNITGTTGLVLNSGTGGVDINTTGTGDLTLTSGDSVLVDAVGSLELNSSGGDIKIGNDADANDIYIGSGASVRTLTLGNTSGASGIVMNSGTAGITLNGHIMTTETVVVATDPLPTANESGKVFLIPAIAATTITLPAPVAGLRYEFIATGAVTANVSIDCDVGLLIGQVYSSAGAVEDTGTADRYIKFITGTSVQGDTCVVTSDGTKWIAKCYCGATGGITLT